MSEPGNVDWKPLMRSLCPTKTVSFELTEVTPLPPHKPSASAPPTPSTPLQNTASAPQATVVPTSLVPVTATSPNPPTRSTSLSRFLQWLNGVSSSHENEEARRFHLFLNLSCPEEAPSPYFPRDSLYAQGKFLSKHVDAHETWSQSVVSILARKQMQSPTRHLATHEKVSEALQAPAKSTGNSGGGPDASIYSFGLNVRW